MFYIISKIAFCNFNKINLRIFIGKTSIKNLTVCKKIHERLMNIHNSIGCDEILHHFIAPKIAEPIIPALLENFAFSITILF